MDAAPPQDQGVMSEGGRAAECPSGGCRKETIVFLDVFIIFHVCRPASGFLRRRKQLLAHFPLGGRMSRSFPLTYRTVAL
jgi:hypothetical protein